MTLKEFFGPLGRWWTATEPAVPTAFSIAVSTLEQTRKDRLEHANHGEYHSAMETMLKQRAVRLKQDIQEFMEPADPAVRD